MRCWWALGLTILVPALGAGCGESFSSAPGGAGGTGTGTGAGGTGTGQGGVAVGGGGGLVSNGGGGGVVASGGGGIGGAGPAGGGGSGLASSGGQGQGGGSSQSGVLCNGMPCNPGASCCYTIPGGIQEPICLSDCPTEQLEVSCDDQNDCAADRTCCYSVINQTISCETACNLTKLCVTVSDCDGGAGCCEILDTGLYRCTMDTAGSCK